MLAWVRMAIGSAGPCDGHTQTGLVTAFVCCHRVPQRGEAGHWDILGTSRAQGHPLGNVLVNQG